MDSTPTAVPGAPCASKSLTQHARQPNKTPGHTLMETEIPQACDVGAGAASMVAAQACAEQSTAPDGYADRVASKKRRSGKGKGPARASAATRSGVPGKWLSGGR